MRKPLITLERAKAVLSYDPITGNIYWLISAKRGISSGQIAGHVDKKYRRISIDGANYRANRLAWFLFYGEWPKLIVDHINGDGLDNRICNLRDVTQTVNMQNQRKARPENKSGYLGVSPCKGKWRAQIVINGVKKYLGQYKTKEMASNVYLAAKRIEHIGCTI